MSKIDHLIQQLCPNGVEWKTLGEVFRISRGRVLSKDFLRENEGIYPVYSSQTLDNGEIGKISTFDYDGDYLTWTTDGANAGTVFHRYGKFSITNVCGLLQATTQLINAGFAYYYLSACMKSYVSEGMGNPKLMSNVVAKISIPIPPLPVQEEIVRILDTFTMLVSELEAELEARKAQYAYYRNRLLTPIEENGKWLLNGKEVEWKTLGEVCSLEYGKPLKSEDRKSGDYPVVGSNGIVGYHDTYLVKAPCIIIGRKGSAGALNWITKDCYPIDTTFFVLLKSNMVMLRFLYQYLRMIGLVSEAMSTGVPGLNRNDVYRISVPIPPMEEQERIVAILDKFDALVNDISVGIPAEIAARRKQYEYYREKLAMMNRQ